MKSLLGVIIFYATSGFIGFVFGALFATRDDPETTRTDESAWDFCVQVAYETKLPTLHVPGKGCVIYAEKKIDGGA